MTGLAVKIALAGVGNLASVFVQGLKFYSGEEKKGLWHPNVAGLRPRDIHVVAAFDVDSRKVGLELSKAVFAPPNVARRYLTLAAGGATVDPGISVGDTAPHLKGVRLDSAGTDDVADRLGRSRADMLVNLISSGSAASSEEYARAALKAGCGFINCTPSLVLKNSGLVAGFRRARLPLVGDDLMSQFGWTFFHNGLLALMV